MKQRPTEAISKRARRQRSKIVFTTLAVLALLTTMFAIPSSAHESPNDGHVPANTNYGFEVIGRDVLEGITDGKYTDVWSQDGFAYIGTFQTPECSTAGVFIVDIAAAIASYPNTSGATVGEIKSPPDTRINDVKTIDVNGTTVLITTEEPCGAGTNGGAVSDFNINKPCPVTGNDADGDGENDIADCNRANTNGNKDEIGRRDPGAPAQKGRGGISLWDVTDPTNPRPLEKSFLDFGGVHNTYPYQGVDGRFYLLGTADTFDFFDTFIVDITNPSKPEILTLTGALDWIPQGLKLDQLETGQSAGIFNHDVWHQQIGGRDIAVVPYWDLGFVTLDVTDPTNPIFINDSTFPPTDPLGRAYEGNAHAAVFGGNGDYIFGGDEDFDPSTFAVVFEGTNYDAGSADFGLSVDEAGFAGPVIWSEGEGCSAGEIPPASDPGEIALVQRGGCEFSDKALSAQDQGYAGYIVANDEARGDALLTMAPGVVADQVTIPGVFVGYSTGEAMKAGGSVTSAGNLAFNGWGYLRVLDNRPGGNLNEIGYYAPAETLEEGLGTAFGDLTMHNVEVDPTNQDVVPTFEAGPRMFVSWYSLGMRALEYRPGHFHSNANGEGSYSQNVHEVGRFIAEDGSNFWGVHVDTVEIDGEEQQIILGSDRNTGLWIFTFGCEDDVDVEGPFYCERGNDE